MELSFTKSFLFLLDSRPIKLSADHVFDPEQVGLRIPYTLPRLPPNHPPMPPRTKKRIVPGLSKSITIHLKSARNPSLELTLPNAPLSTTNVEELKTTVRGHLVDTQGNKVALEKIKILHHRKPVSGNNKTIAEVLEDEPGALSGGKEVEFGVMVLGGTGVKVVEQQSDEGAMAQTEKKNGEREEQGKESIKDFPKSIEEGLRSEAFWDDLQGFLVQKLQDENGGRKLKALFEDAWARR